MKKILTAGLLLLLACFSLNGAKIDYPEPEMNYPLNSSNAELYVPWTLCYSEAVPVHMYSPFELIILDSDFHVPFADLVDGGKRVLGYVSIGEIEDFRYYFTQAQNEGLLLFESPFSPGAWFVDLRLQEWTDMLLQTVIPNILNQGFTGFFMDTLDDAAYLEEIDPILYAGMVQAGANVVKALRAAFPEATIMQNRGYEVMDVSSTQGREIDIFTGEDVYSFWNGSAYEIQPTSEFIAQSTKLQDYAKNYPHLEVMTIDYWNPADPTTIATIYQQERNKGLHPYVTVANIDQIVYEPPRS